LCEVTWVFLSILGEVAETPMRRSALFVRGSRGESPVDLGTRRGFSI